VAAGRSKSAREKLGTFARSGREVANEDCRIVILNAHVCGAQIDRAGIGCDGFEVDAPEAPRLFTTAAQRNKAVERARPLLHREW